MRTHVTVLAWLQVAMGVLDLLMALALFGVIAGLGALMGLPGGAGGAIFGGVVGTVVAAVMALTALPNLLAAYGLLQYRNWGRILALLLAILNGLKFPWGTAFALYTLWVLLDGRTRALFGRT